MPELFKLWWAPKSLGVPLLACEKDVRTGGGYSLTFGQDPAKAMSFYGKYLEVSPPSRLVWTNDDCDEGSITTVTFEDTDGGPLLTLHELYTSREAFVVVFGV